MKCWLFFTQLFFFSLLKSKHNLFISVRYSFTLKWQFRGHKLVYNLREILSLLPLAARWINLYFRAACTFYWEQECFFVVVLLLFKMNYVVLSRQRHIHNEFRSEFFALFFILNSIFHRFFVDRTETMSNKVVCYAHPDAHLIEDYRAGDMICSECGLVVGDRVIDVGSEWRTFSNEKSGVDPSRVGGPENPLLSGGDLSTMIGPGTGAASFDAFGSKFMGFEYIFNQNRTKNTTRRKSIIHQLGSNM